MLIDAWIVAVHAAAAWNSVVDQQNRFLRRGGGRGAQRFQRLGTSASATEVLIRRRRPLLRLSFSSSSINDGSVAKEEGGNGYQHQQSHSYGDETNPDQTGVYVDGFPLPPTPSRDDDEDLMNNLRKVPITPLTEPLPPRKLLNEEQRPLTVLIAGGGLGGLALASHLIQLGNIDVHVFEQAIQYKPFGGPIQIQSNALWALQQMNPVILDAIQQCGVQTGDRLSGIKDGIRYDEGWLVKFDATTPAIKNGLPLTLAINRVALQDIFLKYGVPHERVHTSSRVVSYRNLRGGDDKDGNGGGVEVALQDGSKVYGDILVGADGMWSRVRHQMMDLPSSEVGPKYATKHASYSGYTCFTGTCKHTPADIDEVAYKVFLGQEQYLGCTDAGHGWQHWWAFLPDAPADPTSYESSIIVNEDDGSKFLERLKREFRDWSPEIMDLFDATKPEVVKKRPLFDRPPMWQSGWVDGNVALLGDSAHPTMPNLGQGGAMAIEDAYVFGQQLSSLSHTEEIPERLKSYEQRRFIRASIAQFLSRNGSDLLVDWDKVRNTPIVGPIAMWCVNVFQPISMNYLYSAKL